MPTINFEELVEIPAGLETLADFRRWTLSDAFPEQGRIDFIGGRIEVDMSPERLDFHAAVKSALAFGLMQQVEASGLGQVYVDRARVASPVAGLSCEPDIVYVSWASRKAGDVRYIQAPQPIGPTDPLEIEGGPDLVVEIVSPSSKAKDTQRLPPAYFAAGVREFWLADALGKQVVFEIHTRGKKGFRKVAAGKDGFVKSPLFGASFRLRRRAGPVENSVVYRLETRA
ncbi:MAG: Uma2 family endonuclease [Planctomycetota bacterium]|nr:Uma2 family endonuclease [Planctomycetota bacterium]